MSSPQAFGEAAYPDGVKAKQDSGSLTPLSANEQALYDTNTPEERDVLNSNSGEENQKHVSRYGLVKAKHEHAQSQEDTEHAAKIPGSVAPQPTSVEQNDSAHMQDLPLTRHNVPSGSLPMEEDMMLSQDHGAPLLSPVSARDYTGPEIQSIIDQFDESVSLTDNHDSQIRANASQHPPRTSSLGEELVEEAKYGDGTSSDNTLKNIDNPSSQSENLHRDSKPESIRSLSFSQHSRYGLPEANKSMSPLSSPSLHKALPPAPEPEPDLPFDFHRFLDQLRHRTADPVAKFLRSFLFEFGKKQWMVHEQVKIISDFLTFITSKMGQCEVWRDVSDAEFDNAREGMEKLVMNRLYSQTFSPAIPPALQPPVKGKRKGELQGGPHRRGQHQEDIERDNILAQKVRIYEWIRPEHLDISFMEDGGKRFLLLAQQELLKIKSYRAPRDKVICVLNCCKVIFGLLRNSKSRDTSADSFMPLLIYVILQANPEHLVSNMQYVLRFRNQDKLGGEAGYYISSLMGAVQFIENLDRTSLTITDKEFEEKVEAAVSTIAERESIDIPADSAVSVGSQTKEASGTAKNAPGPSQKARLGDRRDPRGSSESESTPDEQAAVTSLLRSIQRPLSNIGRLFTEDQPASQYPGNSNVRLERVNALPPETPRRKLSPALLQPPSNGLSNNNPPIETRSLTGTSAEDAAARQASAEAAEAQRIHRAEHKDVVETLAGMFPNLDKDIIDDVVRLKEGRVGSAVDACLALNTDT